MTIAIAPLPTAATATIESGVAATHLCEDRIIRLLGNARGLRRAEVVVARA